MAKPKQKPSPKARAAAARRPEPPPPPPVELPVTAPVERMPRRGLLTAGLVVAGCFAATVLLLSGWTPGPGLPKPPRSVTRAAPAAPAPRKARTPAKPRKAVKRVARPRPKPLSAAADLFAGECGFCHTLAEAGTTGRAGPNLDQLRPSRQRVLAAIAAGGRRTGLMPPGILTGAEARQVAKYVARVTRR
ncbi:MAG: cytochrome c [Thermoleophilia bacterium]|nr:cytochrome c [Thermoleophilia bacterium]